MDLARKELTTEIFAKLNSLSRDVRPSEFQVKLIEREIARIATMDRSGAYQLSGALASLRGDVEDMHLNHQAAVRSAPGDDGAWTNYACSLFRMGFVHESIDKLRRAHELDPMDLDTVDALVGHSFAGGQFTEAIRWLREREKRSPDTRHDQAADVLTAAEIQNECGLTDADTGALVELAMDAAHKADIYSVDLEMGLRADNDSMWLSLLVCPRIAKGQVEKLNADLVDAIVEGDLKPTSTSALVVRFTAALTDADNSKTVAGIR
jgi:tetratricopeptide (TPR) repeat protein